MKQSVHTVCNKVFFIMEQSVRHCELTDYLYCGRERDMHLECLIPDFGGLQIPLADGLQILYLQAICKRGSRV